MTSGRKSFCVNLARIVVARHFPDPKKAVMTLALGKMQEPPFSPGELQRLRVEWFNLLPNPAEASIQPPFHPLFLSAIGQTLKEMGDPDWKIMASTVHSYASGVRLGVGIKMPRTPAVFKKKTHWCRYEESELALDVKN